MKTFISILIFLICFSRFSTAQVTGPDSVCAGYLYNFTANIPGADSISWTYPTGWYIITNSGSQVEFLCNHSVGQICADGFDSLGNLLTHLCKTVYWGGSGLGWDVQFQATTFCQCPDYVVSVYPNTTTQCGSCSAGTISPNLRFAIYDNPWPTGQFVGYADGVSPIPSPLVMTMYFVYQVDITFGIANAILIDGGLCLVTNNNTFLLYPCWHSHLFIIQSPDPVCIGDTLSLQYDTLSGPFALSSFSWVATSNVTFIPPLNLDHIQCIINSSGFTSITLSCYDFNGCPYAGDNTPNFITCNLQLPVAAFHPNDSIICEGNCISFMNTSSNATEYHWVFPGGNPSSDTSANPQIICYSSSGTFGALLIATNSNGSDTMSMNNFLTVHPAVQFSPLVQHGDTLFCTPGFTNYQWYSDTTIIPGANDYYYIATQSGDYSVEIADSNGCTALAKLLGVIASVDDEKISTDNFKVMYSSGTILLNINSHAESSYIIRLIDIFGKEIYQNNIPVEKGNNEFKISGINLSYGIYFIKLINSRQEMVKKIFIR